MASSGWLTPYQTLTDSGFGYSYFKGAIYISSITRSGTTVTVSAKFGVYNDGGASSYYQYPINAKIRDVTGYYQVVGGGVWIGTNQWVETGLFTFTLTVPVATTTASITIDWVYNNGYRGNTISYTLSFDSGIPTPTLTGIGVTTTTATVGWLVDDGVGNIDGTGYIYGGTTASPTTQLFTTTLKNDTFVDTGLTPNTQYYYRGRIKDSNDNWGPYTPLDVRLTTLAPQEAMYGSVNGQSKKFQKFYGAVRKLADFTPVITDTNLLITSFDRAIFLGMMNTYHQNWLLEPAVDGLRIRLNFTMMGGTPQYQLSMYKNSQVQEYVATTTTQVQSYGFSLATPSSSLDGKIAYIDITNKVWDSSAISKEIVKFYGSVNGLSKLLYSK